MILQYFAPLNVRASATYCLFFLRGDTDGEVLIFEELILVCEPEPAPDIDNATKTALMIEHEYTYQWYQGLLVDVSHGKILS